MWFGSVKTTIMLDLLLVTLLLLLFSVMSFNLSCPFLIISITLLYNKEPVSHSFYSLSVSVSCVAATGPVQCYKCLLHDLSSSQSCLLKVFIWKFLFCREIQRIHLFTQTNPQSPKQHWHTKNKEGKFRLPITALFQSEHSHVLHET